MHRKVLLGRVLRLETVHYRDDVSGENISRNVSDKIMFLEGKISLGFEDALSWGLAFLTHARRKMFPTAKVELGGHQQTFRVQ